MNTLLNTLLFDDVPGHFPMGRPDGRIIPTDERISDTDSTPLGLTLRVEPLKASETWGPKPTKQATESTSDGVEGENTNKQADSVDDETW